MTNRGDVEESSYIGGYLRLWIKGMFHGEISVQFIIWNPEYKHEEIMATWIFVHVIQYSNIKLGIRAPNLVSVYGSYSQVFIDSNLRIY